jgi:hypothetical protein
MTFVELNSVICLWLPTDYTQVVMAVTPSRLHICFTYTYSILLNHLHSNKSTNQMYHLSDLLLVVQIQLNMFRASSCPLSEAYKLQ